LPATKSGTLSKAENGNGDPNTSHVTRESNNYGEEVKSRATSEDDEIRAGVGRAGTSSGAIKGIPIKFRSIRILFLELTSIVSKLHSGWKEVRTYKRPVMNARPLSLSLLCSHFIPNAILIPTI
jgi:hypothetical protein